MALTIGALAILALVLLLAACGGDEEPLTGITSVDDLRGKTIGVSSFEDTATLELRSVLQESYGLVAGIDFTDVTLVELPVLELLTQLRQGEVDAVLIPPGSALAQFDEVEFRILSRTGWRSGGCSTACCCVANCHATLCHRTSCRPSSLRPD